MLSKLFRGKLLAALDSAYRAGELELTGSCAELAEPKAFARLKDKLYKAKWVSYAKEPFAGPEQVFAYLGRYTHRVGISNQRLLELSKQGVRFRTWDDATTTLAPNDFIHRFLQHVLPPGFVKIRHYGLLASSNATTKLEVARALLEAQHTGFAIAIGLATAVLLARRQAQPRHLEGWRELLERLTGIDLSRCPKCSIGTLRPMPLPRLLPPHLHRAYDTS